MMSACTVGTGPLIVEAYGPAHGVNGFYVHTGACSFQCMHNSGKSMSIDKFGNGRLGGHELKSPNLLPQLVELRFCTSDAIVDNLRSLGLRASNTGHVVQFCGRCFNAQCTWNLLEQRLIANKDDIALAMDCVNLAMPDLTPDHAGEYDI